MYRAFTVIKQNYIHRVHFTNNSPPCYSYISLFIN